MIENMQYMGTITVNLLKQNPETGEWYKAITRKQKNVLLNVGKDYLIQRIMDDGANVVSGTACQVFTVGTSASAGAAAATDTTATDVEIGRATFTYASGSTRGQCSATATFDTGTAVGNITEAGIYAGVVGTSGDGVFFARVLFTAVNKNTEDRLQIKWDVSFS